MREECRCEVWLCEKRPHMKNLRSKLKTREERERKQVGCWSHCNPAGTIRWVACLWMAVLFPSVFGIIQVVPRAEFRAPVLYKLDLCWGTKFFSFILFFSFWMDLTPPYYPGIRRKTYLMWREHSCLSTNLGDPICPSWLSPAYPGWRVGLGGGWTDQSREQLVPCWNALEMRKVSFHLIHSCSLSGLIAERHVRGTAQKLLVEF